MVCEKNRHLGLNMQNLKANIWKLYCIHGIRFFLIFMPVLVIYFHNFGLSYAQIFLTQAVFSLLLLGGALPGGYFCDKVGRKAGMILGAIFWIVGNVCMVFWHCFVGFFVAEIFWGIAYALFSGAQPALLFDTLMQLQEEEAYTNYEGKVEFYGRWSESVAAILGGLAALISVRAPFIISLMVSVLLLLAVLTLTEVKAESSGLSYWSKWRGDVRAILDCTFLKQKAVGWLLIFSAAISLATLSSIWLYQPYFYHLNVSLGWFGIGWAIINLGAAYSARHAGILEQKFGLNTLLAVIFFGVVLSCYFLSTQFALGFFIFAVLTQALRGLKIPLVFNFVNQRTPSDIRATVLSFDAFFMRILFIVFCPFIGYWADKNQLLSAFSALTVSVFVLGLMSLLMFFYRSKA